MEGEEGDEAAEVVWEVIFGHLIFFCCETSSPWGCIYTPWIQAKRSNIYSKYIVQTDNKLQFCSLSTPLIINHK